MVLQKLVSIGKSLENSEHPLLGPNLKGLYWSGLWLSSSKIRNILYNIFHYSSSCFLLCEIIEVFTLRNDVNKLLSNLSLTALSIITLLKCLSYVHWQGKWRELTNIISEEEIREIEKCNQNHMKILKNCKGYARFVTYSYWTLVLITLFALIATPLLKYFSLSSYRNDIQNGDEPYPEIISLWFPFNKNSHIGCLFASLVEAIMATKGSAVIAVYDTNCVVIMIFLKGQMKILKDKCANIFEDNSTSTEIMLAKIKECHRHHNFLIRCYKLFDSLLSPIMFAYVLVCSITICFSVVQFISDKATTFHKLWVIEYTSGLIAQLFLYCWHSNEVIIESTNLDQSVYESNWWKADVRLRRQILLLAGKLTPSFLLHAGPFTTLSVPTFIEIVKGAYSFFTLFSKIQD